MRFKVTGSGKQNLSGGQLVAINIGNEAQKKAHLAISRMRGLVDYVIAPTNSGESEEQIMQQYGISNTSGYFTINGYDFDTLCEAIGFAKGAR